MSILNSAARVLRLLANSERDLTVMDISNGLAIPKSSASRLLKQMQDCGFLERDPRTLGYRPALLLLEVSHQVRATTPLLSRMERALAELVHASGHTGYISALDETGTHVVVLRVHNGTQPLRVVTWPGHRSPALSTSTGRALLARLSDEDIANRFDALRSEAAVATPHELGAFSNEIARIRTSRWASAQSEALPGVSSLSCAVQDPATGEALAFCLSFPSGERDADSFSTLAHQLTTQASIIGRAVADPFWITRNHPDNH